MSNSTVSTITATLSTILLIIGMIFVIRKIITKKTQKSNSELSAIKSKKILYNLHMSTTALATILGFVHGFTVETINQTYVITGWILGFSMIVMTSQGIFLGFQNRWHPFSEEEDQKYKFSRIIKWILTFIMIIALVGHFVF
ncbi:hypothetical protein [Candidatus Lokiarchaeum ossiferum]|uniref:hypothetical protein n=1 Tax=Candidatus Lokiarchaeum ossiferum TaxID=2951803 RepID=UPI00352F730E